MVKTIWSPGAVDHIPPRYRLLVQAVYPAIYLLNILAYGFVGSVTGGSMYLRMALPYPGANILNLLIGLFALVGLLGIVFGGGKRTFRGQTVERIGALGLIPPTLVYFITLTAALGGGPNTPLGALVGCALMIMFGLIRAFDLSVQIGINTRRRS